MSLHPEQLPPPTAMTDISRASLLGLPCELRLQIYNHARHLDFTVLKAGPEHRFARVRLDALPKHRSEDRLCLHDVELMLTCRAIANEVRESNRTYELNHRANNVQRLTWRRLPCSPADIQVLLLTCAFKGDRRYWCWGNGAPGSVVMSLCDTLRCFLRCGPMTETKRPLPEHLHLRELVVRFEAQGCSWRGPWEGSAGKANRLVQDLRDWGLLSGHIDRIRLVNDECEDAEVVYSSM